MLLLVYYTASTPNGQLEGNITLGVDRLKTSEDVEALRDRVTKDVEGLGITLLGSGKVVFGNITNLDRL